jgi:hypothetical protein
MTMRSRLRMFAAPVLAVVAVTMGLAAVAAPTASAAITRQTYAQVFYGAPSVTVPQCQATGQSLQAAGRFDFFHCVPFPGSDPAEELEGFIILG